MKSGLEFLLQRAKDQALALDAGLPRKGSRDDGKVEVRFAAVAPSSVTSVSLGLVNQLQCYGLKKGQVVANSVCDANTHD